VNHQWSDGDTRAIGVYQIIEAKKKLVFTWHVGRDDELATLVTLLFRPVGNSISQLMFLHERLHDADRVEGYSGAWSFGFDQLAIVLA